MSLFSLLVHIAPQPSEVVRLDLNRMIMAERCFIVAVVRERLERAESDLRPPMG